MRLDVQSENRLGITNEILAVFVQHKIDVRAVDMVTNHTFVDAPLVTEDVLQQITPDLLSIEGVRDVLPVALLPSEEKARQLMSVFAALNEPMIAISDEGEIVFSNQSAAQLLNVATPDELAGKLLDSLLPNGIFRKVREHGFYLAEQEVVTSNGTFMVHAVPVNLDTIGGVRRLGCVVVLQPLMKMGRMMTVLMSKGVTGFETIIGRSNAMQQIKLRGERLANLDAPLLIMGETGTGKDMFARACHMTSKRSDMPFLKVDCAAMTASEAETELFGHVSGAFETGIDEGKPGVLELAHGGSVFLNEVGELSNHLQAKLLRFLEDSLVTRIGDTKGRPVDVRIIASTRSDLLDLSAKGHFRSDLLYRLNVLNITLPKLSDRLQDIPELVEAFTRRASARLGRPKPDVQEKAVRALAKHDWPGNVRQLENTVFQTLSMLKEGEKVTEFILDLPDSSSTGERNTDRQSWGDYQTAFEAFEQRLFATLYRTYGSSRSLAKRLKLSHTTVARKLLKYGIGRS